LVKNIVKLAKDSDYRRQCCVAVVYGEHALLEAVKHGLLKQVIILDEACAKYRATLEIIDNHLDIYVVNRQIISKLNILSSTTDILAIISIVNAKGLTNFYNSDCLLLENIQDPGNLGVMLRLAAAAGVTNVGLIGNCVDVYNPKVIRASQGLQFALNICAIDNFIEFSDNYTGQIIATTPLATELIYALDLRLPTAFVFGNEGNGLSANLLDKIDRQACIPLAPQVDSLNVAMAAGVCVFEMVRQRKFCN